MARQDAKKSDDDATKKAQGRRLRAAREKQGFTKAKQAARFYRWSEDTYPQHESGRRSIRNAAETYAEAFGVTAEWLVYGTNPPPWAVSDVELSADERRGGAEHFLRPWRLYRGLTEEDLADALQVSVDMVQAWEQGAHDVSAKWLRKIASRLDTSPGSLLDVDPGAVPRDLLDLWLEQARQQGAIARRLATLRTGTNG